MILILRIKLGGYIKNLEIQECQLIFAKKLQKNILINKSFKNHKGMRFYLNLKIGIYQNQRKGFLINQSFHKRIQFTLNDT